MYGGRLIGLHDGISEEEERPGSNSTSTTKSQWSGPAMLIAVDDALGALAQQDSCMARLIEMRFFGA